MTVEPQPPDGEKIATEIEREMEQRLYRLRHVVLAPAEYHVYLHPDDFAHIKDVASLIELDVQQCLNAAVERMNGRSSLLNFVLPKQTAQEMITRKLNEPEEKPTETKPNGSTAQIKENNQNTAK